MPDPDATTAKGQRLCAVLFADMVGYSSLRQEDGLRFKDEMLALARRALEDHKGRMVQTYGDGFLAELPTATGAVAFALELQDRIRQRNSAVAPRQRFKIRIGIHAGEVVVGGENIEGMTVNIAARTEPLAAPGGICLTEEVWREVQETLPGKAHRLGRVRVKGIRRPLCFYHVHPPGAGWVARRQLRLRLFFNWPGRVGVAILVTGVLLALVAWLWPLGPDVLDRLLPAGAPQLVDRAQRRLQRFDRPGDIERALDDLRKAAVLDPQFTDAHAWLGLAYWRRYKWRTDEADRFEAWTSSSNALAHNPRSPLAHFVQGVVALEENRLSEATNHLVLANEAARWKDGEVLLELATACRRLSAGSNAAFYVQRAGQVQEKPWYFYNRLGQYEFALGQFGVAQTNFQMAVRLAPDSPIAWLNLGYAWECQDDRRPALKCFQKSLRLWRTDIAYDGLGVHYLSEDDWQAAAGCFLEAAKLNPFRYDLPGKAGLALLHVPERRDAARELLASAADKAQALLKRAWKPFVAANLGLYQAGLGEYAEARRTFEKVLAQPLDDSRVLNNLQSAADLLRMQQRPTEADALLRLLPQSDSPQPAETPH